MSSSIRDLPDKTEYLRCSSKKTLENMLSQCFIIDGSFAALQVIGEEVRKGALKLGGKRIYWITASWKSLLRKLPEEVQLSEGKVMEVVL